MRKAVNENPVVQAVVIGVLLVAGALLLLTRMGGSGSSTPSAATTSTSTTVTGPTGATADVTASTDGTSANISATVTPPPGGATPAAAPAAAPVGPFEAGPGLPRSVFASYQRGKTVVLYVYDPKGVEDRDMLTAVNGLKGDSSLAVFTTPSKDIARYSRITQGVGVSEVPALIVISPNQGSGEPKATVSYGFRGSESVTQAVRDAVYKGKTLGYDPG
jgi:hypothetical protein